MRAVWYAGSVAIICLGLLGCGKDPNVLDREEAQELVQMAVNLQPPSEGCLAMRNDGWEAGRSQGYWAQEWITEKGQPHFSSVRRDQLCVTQPLPRIVEIQGIADTPIAGYKEVHFYISHQNITDPAKRFIVAGYKGGAMARRFDDGWRLEGGVQYSKDQSAIVLSESENAALQADFDAEVVRQNEAEYAQIKQQESFDALAAESRTAKKPYQTFHCDAVFGDRRSIIDVSVNDVHVIKVGKTMQTMGSVTGTSTYPYGHIPSYKIEEDWLKLEQKNAGSGTHFMGFYPKQCDNFAALSKAITQSYDGWWAKYGAVGSAQ